MPNSAVDLIVAAVVLYLGMVLQSIVGFGSGFLVIPILVWCGVELPHAIALLCTAVLVQASVGAWSLRRDIKGKEVLFSCVFRFLGVFLGIYLLTLLVQLDKAQIKQCIGAILLSVLILQRLFRVEPREKLHPAWSITAFFSSGALAGIVGMGAPPLVLWLMAHRWTNRETRAFLFTNFLAATPLLIVLLYLTFGGKILQSVLVGLLLSPLVAHASKVGVKLGNRLSKERLRDYAYLLLLCIALASIAAPLIQRVIFL